MLLLATFYFYQLNSSLFFSKVDDKEGFTWLKYLTVFSIIIVILVGCMQDGAALFNFSDAYKDTRYSRFFVPLDPIFLFTIATAGEESRIFET